MSEMENILCLALAVPEAGTMALKRSGCSVGCKTVIFKHSLGTLTQLVL